MAIGFYFSGAGGSVQLPVNPEEITVKFEGNNMRTEIVKLGEINILRDRKLASIALEFLLPGDNYYPFITGRWQKPMAIVHFFRGFLDMKKPLRFIVSEFGVNMQMSVESVSDQRAAGDHDSVKCALSLLQYRPYGAKTLKLQSSGGSGAESASEPSRTTDKQEKKTVTLEPGDSFWSVAQRELGDGSRYNEICELNGMTASTVIHPGQVLLLPAR